MSAWQSGFVIFSPYDTFTPNEPFPMASPAPLVSVFADLPDTQDAGEDEILHEATLAFVTEQKAAKKPNRGKKITLSLKPPPLRRSIAGDSESLVDLTGDCPTSPPVLVRCNAIGPNSDSASGDSENSEENMGGHQEATPTTVGKKRVGGKRKPADKPAEEPAASSGSDSGSGSKSSKTASTSKPRATKKNKDSSPVQASEKPGESKANSDGTALLRSETTGRDVIGGPKYKIPEPTAKAVTFFSNKFGKQVTRREVSGMVFFNGEKPLGNFYVSPDKEKYHQEVKEGAKIKAWIEPKLDILEEVTEKIVSVSCEKLALPLEKLSIFRENIHTLIESKTWENMNISAGDILQFIVKYVAYTFKEGEDGKASLSIMIGPVPNSITYACMGIPPDHYHDFQTLFSNRIEKRLGGL